MIKRIALVLLACMILCGGLTAQQTKSRIVGTVTDSEGSFLPGVTVTAVNPKMVGKAETITDENGVYRLLNLTPGVFRVEYALEGFQTVVRENIRLTLEQTLNLDVSLTLGKLEERIEVSGKAPLIDVKNTSKGMTLTRELFSTLPKGRNFDTLMSTIPGVHQEKLPENDTRLRGSDPSGARTYSGGTSVDGASGAENMYFLDGVNTTGLQSGRAGLQASFEFIDEVQVKASGYQAEFGGSLGGVVNVVTRAGGNRFSGEIIGYYSGSALQGKERDTLRLNPENLDVVEYVNYQDMYGKDKTDRMEVGFGLGGYIFKDKLWFFGSFLPVFKTTERDVEFLSGDIAEGTYEKKEYYWNYSFKLTSQPFKNLRLSASFANNLYKWRGDLPSRAGTSNSAKDWAGTGFDYPGYNIAASM
ncbi:MAG: TonB-dependent receptor, partial [Candidatus Aminicenantes bacterium]|nr:TonB-dependent receptor [Candidatus Aminicenantes bacterium]